MACYNKCVHGALNLYTWIFCNGCLKCICLYELDWDSHFGCCRCTHCSYGVGFKLRNIDTSFCHHAFHPSGDVDWLMWFYNSSKERVLFSGVGSMWFCASWTDHGPPAAVHFPGKSTPDHPHLDASVSRVSEATGGEIGQHISALKTFIHQLTESAIASWCDNCMYLCCRNSDESLESSIVKRSFLNGRYAWDYHPNQMSRMATRDRSHVDVYISSLVCSLSWKGVTVLCQWSVWGIWRPNTLSCMQAYITWHKTCY